MDDLTLSGFQVTHISEPSSLTVGISLRHASSETGSASSTHAIIMRALDLIESRLRRSPANRRDRVERMWFVAKVQLYAIM